MQDDITRLVRKPPADKRLDTAATPKPMREQTGLERKTAGSVSSNEVTVQSTDGLFAFTVRVVKA